LFAKEDITQLDLKNGKFADVLLVKRILQGPYWTNQYESNNRVFLIGSPVINPIEVYGSCPESYVEEIIL
jgi:hypothetical protein